MRDKEESTVAKYAQLVADLQASVFEGRGRVDKTLRASAATGQGLAEPWPTYTAKIRNEAWTVTDADVEALKAAGHSEDEIFEMTVAAAVGASMHALDAGLRALNAKD